MPELASQTRSGSPIRIRTVPADAHWRWLAAGWRDFRASGIVAIAAGLIVTGILAMAAGLLWLGGFISYIPAAVGGFALVGPVFAIGCYDMSRRLANGEPVTFAAILKPVIASPGQTALIGFALFLLLMIWARLATLLYALAVGAAPIGANRDFVAFVLETPEGLSMLAIGGVVGGILAIIAFAMSVISLPMTAHRQVDAMTAMIFSGVAVAKNKRALLFFGFNIALLIGLCALTGFLGLIVIFPWLGHATWHAYRDLVI